MIAKEKYTASIEFLKLGLNPTLILNGVAAVTAPITSILTYAQIK